MNILVITGKRIFASFIEFEHSVMLIWVFVKCIPTEINTQ